MHEGLNTTVSNVATSPMSGLGTTEHASTLQQATGAERLLDPLLQFGDGWFLLDLVLGYLFAIAFAAALTWSPGRLSGARAERELNSGGTLLLLAIIGVTVAELVALVPAMALVIFGIGGLIRFRTSMGDTELTGKGIIIVIIGLACGLSQIAMAFFVTIVAWIILFYLEKRVGCLVRIMPQEADQIDSTLLRDTLGPVLRQDRIRLMSMEAQRLDDDTKEPRVEIFLSVPTGHTTEMVRSVIRGSLPDTMRTAKVTVEFR